MLGHAHPPVADRHHPNEPLPTLHANEGWGHKGIAADGRLDRFAALIEAVFERDEVHELPVGELNRRTSAVLRNFADGGGQRRIITRHGEPRAVLLSVRDAIEILVSPALAESAAAAAADLAAGRIMRPWEHAGPIRPVLGAAAAEKYHRLGGLARGDLRMGLCRGDADERRPLWLSHGKWLAPFSYQEPDVALVHDLIEVRPLEWELFGDQISLERQRRSIDRRLHARTAWHRR